MLNAHGFLAKIFEIFEKYKKAVDMISTSEINVSMTIDNDEDIDALLAELEGIAHTNIHKNKSIIYVVGGSTKHRIGTAGKIFSLMAENDVNIDMISACYEEISIGFIIDEDIAEKAVNILHSELVKI